MSLTLPKSSVHNLRLVLRLFFLNFLLLTFQIELGIYSYILTREEKISSPVKIDVHLMFLQRMPAIQ